MSHVSSALELDILLAMRASDGSRAAGELARELRLNESAAAAALDKFATNGLLAPSEGGYDYRPSSTRLAASVDALAQVYATHRVRVIRFIFKQPGESVSAFADAFKFRKDR